MVLTFYSRSPALVFFPFPYSGAAQAMGETANKGFGGGNTDWEERTLGDYRTSETRLVEIIEHACPGHDYGCLQVHMAAQPMGDQAASTGLAGEGRRRWHPA